MNEPTTSCHLSPFQLPVEMKQARGGAECYELVLVDGQVVFGHGVCTVFYQVAAHPVVLAARHDVANALAAVSAPACCTSLTRRGYEPGCYALVKGHCYECCLAVARNALNGTLGGIEGLVGSEVVYQA